MDLSKFNACVDFVFFFDKVIVIDSMNTLVVHAAFILMPGIISTC